MFYIYYGLKYFINIKFVQIRIQVDFKLVKYGLYNEIEKCRIII